MEQVKNAVVILLNRGDLATTVQIGETKNVISTLNPRIPIIKTSFEKRSIEPVMHVGTVS